MIAICKFKTRIHNLHFNFCFSTHFFRSTVQMHPSFFELVHPFFQELTNELLLIFPHDHKQYLFAGHLQNGRYLLLFLHQFVQAAFLKWLSMQW